MSATADQIRARTAAMGAELAPMTRSAAMAWGRHWFDGAAFDGVFGRLTRNPDGSAPDVATACDVLEAWCEQLTAFAGIVRAKPADAPPVVKSKRPRW